MPDPGPEPDIVRLLLEQREAWRAGRGPLVEELLARHPGAGQDPEAVLDLIYNEVVLREGRGEGPVLAEYLARFPHLAVPLRLQFELDDALGAVSASGSPGEDERGAGGDPEGGADGRPVVPGCELLGELGRGAMGVVYRAWQPAARRLVAVKVLNAGVPAARVRTEAEATARLSHPNIVQVFEVKEFRGRTALVLEYVEGGSLAYRTAGRAQPPREAARLVEMAARAMAVAHARGVVHRDLKPANVLLAGPEDAPLSACTPKISDFGLARLLETGPGLTRSGDVVGTPSYMAPEQAGGGDGPVGPLADVYALGAVLYELLTGRPPFAAATVLETLAQVRGQEPVAPRSLRPAIPRDLEVVCLECLRKAPGQRYASATELADDLRAFLDGAPVRARPAGPVERTARWARRRPVAAALVCAALLALGVFGLGTWHFTVQVQQQRDLAELRAGELQTQLGATRRLLFTAQLLRVGAVWEADPAQGLEMLEDRERCPPDLRDFTWGVLWGRCRRYEATLGSNAARVSALAWAPDGATLASGGSAGAVSLWDPATGRELGRLPGRPEGVAALAFAPGGRWLAVGRVGGGVTIWDLPAARVVAGPLAAAEGVRVAALAFSPDGNSLAVHTGPVGGSGSGEVTLWDVDGWRPRRVLSGGTEPASPVAFSAEGRWLACGGQGGVVRLWDPATGKARPPLKGHTRAVRALAFRPEGDTLVSAGGEGGLRVWDGAGEPGVTVELDPGPVGGLSWSPDGRLVAVAWEGGAGGLPSDLPPAVQVVDVEAGKVVERLRGQRSPVTAIAFAPRGPLLATGGAGGEVKLWRVPERDAPLALAGCVGGPGSLAATPDGGTLAWLARSEGRGPTPVEVVVRDLRRGEVRARLPGPFGRPGQTVQRIALSGDGNTVATLAQAGNDAGDLRLWDVATGRELRSLVGHTAPILGLAFSGDGRSLASCGRDRTARVWDLASGAARQVLLGSPLPLTDLGFSPDGTRLLTGAGEPGGAGEVRAWDLTSGEVRVEVALPEAVTALSWATSGTRPVGTVAVGGRSGAVYLIDTASGVVTQVQPGVREVTGLALHPDGRTLAVGGQVARVKLWDVVLRQECGALPGHEGGACLVTFVEQGRALLTGSPSGGARRWVGGVQE